MAVYDFAASGIPAPNEFELELMTNGTVLPSKLSQGVQTITRAGEHFIYTLTWKGLKGAARANFIGFFARLNGVEHRVTFPIYGQLQRGSYGGTPVVDGAGQTGSTLNIRGASNNITNWAQRGDVIKFDNNLRIVTTDVSSDGTGDVSPTIMPRIRTSPADGATVTVGDSITSQFILITPLAIRGSAEKRNANGELYGDFTLTFLEDTNA